MKPSEKDKKKNCGNSQGTGTKIVGFKNTNTFTRKRPPFSPAFPLTGNFRKGPPSKSPVKSLPWGEIHQQRILSQTPPADVSFFSTTSKEPALNEPVEPLFILCPGGDHTGGHRNPDPLSNRKPEVPHKAKLT
jgi:hypothetical protein